MSDMRDEDGQIVDGWIVVTPKRSYLLHGDNSAFEAVWIADATSQQLGLRANPVTGLFRHKFCGQTHQKWCKSLQTNDSY